MSLEIDPRHSYTVFLLPFAYDPRKRKARPSPVGGERFSWQSLDWDKVGWPSPDEIAESIKLGEKKNEEAEKEKYVQKTRKKRSPVWRLQYFMPETNAILYKRARWFELRDESGALADRLPGSAGLQCCLDYAKENPEERKEIIPLRLYWARLVLFEYPASDQAAENDETGLSDFARNGILAVKIGYQPGTRPTMDHHLLMNEAFRFYKIPYYVHSENFKRHDIITGLPGPHEDQSRAESYWAMWDSLLSLPLRDLETEYELMPESWHENAKVQALAGNEAEAYFNFRNSQDSALIGSFCRKDSKRTWDVYPDNRAFVWTCAKLAGAHGMGYLPNFAAEKLEVKSDSMAMLNLWHALLDVDSKPFDIDAYRYAWLQERTYTRWAEQGSLYGFNNFSVALMGAMPEDIAFHFESLYLDMGMLLLQARTSLFQISQRISEDTQERIKEKGIQEHESNNRNKKAGRFKKKECAVKWDKRFRDMRGAFAAFVNLYHFPLLSTQQQGVEMYVNMRRCFDVDDIFKEVKSEIESTHEHAELDAEKATENSLHILTIYGLGIAVGALVGQIFGMSDICNEFFTSSGKGQFWKQLGIVLVFSVAGFFIAKGILNNRNKKK